MVCAADGSVAIIVSSPEPNRLGWPKEVFDVQDET